MLCHVLQLAARTEYVSGGSASWRSLQILAACAQTCREWRSVADAAAQACCAWGWELRTSTPAALLSSRGVQRWARHLRHLEVHIRQGLGRGSFRSLIQSAACLSDVTVVLGALHNESTLTDTAFCDVALASSSSIEYLCVHSYVPSALPASLQRLHEILDAPEHVPLGALEVLLVHCQLPKLAAIELCLHACGQVYLRTAHLMGVCLPALRRLDLQVLLAEPADLDLSWLAEPREFRLFLDLRLPSDFAAPGLRTHAVTSAAAAAHLPADRVQVTLDSGELSAADKHALGQIRAGACEVVLPPQRMDWAPAAREIHLIFEHSDSSHSQPVQIDFSALSPHTHTVMLNLRRGVDTLQVSGYQPVTGRPWRLCVNGASSIEGLPAPVEGSRLCFTVGAPFAPSDAVYLLRTQQAADADD